MRRDYLRRGGERNVSSPRHEVQLLWSFWISSEILIRGGESCRDDVSAPPAMKTLGPIDEAEELQAPQWSRLWLVAVRIASSTRHPLARRIPKTKVVTSPI
jgi:hypothetical protein